MLPHLPGPPIAWRTETLPGPGDGSTGVVPARSLAARQPATPSESESLARRTVVTLALWAAGVRRAVFPSVPNEPERKVATLKSAPWVTRRELAYLAAAGAVARYYIGAN